MTPQQVAEVLQVDVQLLNHWRCLGKGPQFIKAGHFIRYRVAHLEAWLENQTVETEHKLI